MMTSPILVAALWSTLQQTTVGFVAHFPVSTGALHRRLCQRLLASSSSSGKLTTWTIQDNVSRLSTLQTLLSKHGAPGSTGCYHANDLEPVISLQETPELVASLAGDEELANLHPYLFPIAKSKLTGNYICAYRNPNTEESDKLHPWPIVETCLRGPGMKLLAMNSEHLMRRISAESDNLSADPEVIRLYNDGLGKGLIRDKALDVPYEAGSVSKLGYGVEKYVLLRVGPFPDLYELMAEQHAAKGDEQSSLIAAETANSKLAGFASTLRFYSKLLASFPNRREEARDSARMCLRFPLSTIGMSGEDFKEVAVLAQASDQSDSIQEAMKKLGDLYRIMRESERDDDPSRGMTMEQLAIDEANHLLNTAVLEGKSWGSVRQQIGEKFRSVEREDMATFIDFVASCI